MTKTILVTGATDGIGLETAERLVALGHRVLVHGRNPAKLEAAEQRLRAVAANAEIETYRADLSVLSEVDDLAAAIKERYGHLDALINNAGVLKSANPVLDNGQDVRFVVNTIAPYRLTRLLLDLFDDQGRVVNLSSAAQAPVNLAALAGGHAMSDMDAYAQSKLAITMWSRHLATELGESGPVVVSVNPGSLLATKMVKDGFGVAGNDIGIGADILVRAVLSDEFASASGEYFDNDAGRFAAPHPDALDDHKTAAVVEQVHLLAGGDA